MRGRDRAGSAAFFVSGRSPRPIFRAGDSGLPLRRPIGFLISEGFLFLCVVKKQTVEEIAEEDLQFGPHGLVADVGQVAAELYLQLCHYLIRVHLVGDLSTNQLVLARG